MSALAATLIPVKGESLTERRHARSCSTDLRSVAGHLRIDTARRAAAESALRRALVASQGCNGHRPGPIVVSNNPTKPTSSPHPDQRRAISNPASPPEEKPHKWD